MRNANETTNTETHEALLAHALEALEQAEGEQEAAHEALLHDAAHGRLDWAGIAPSDEDAAERLWALLVECTGCGGDEPDPIGPGPANEARARAAETARQQAESDAIQQPKEAKRLWTIVECCHDSDEPIAPWAVAVFGHAADAQEAVRTALADEWDSEENPEEAWGCTLAEYTATEWEDEDEDEGRLFGRNEATEREFFLTAVRVA